MIVKDHFDDRLYIGCPARNPDFGISCEVEIWIGAGEIPAILKKHCAGSVIATGVLIGCPDEEGVAHPEGKFCRLCPNSAG